MGVTEEIILPDVYGEMACIDHLVFVVRETDEGVCFSAKMEPTDEVVDASESDFPEFNCNLSVEDFKRLVKLFLRVDEEISKAPKA